MGVNVFNPAEDYRIDTMGANNPATSITPPGTFSNFWSALGTGIAGGAVSVGRNAAEIFGAAADANLKASVAGNPYATQEQFDYAYSGQPVTPFEDQFKAAADWAKLDPRVVGGGSMQVGQLAHGLTVFGLGSLMGGPMAGAATVGVSEGMDNYRDLREQGVDDKTALASAATTGVLGAAGAFLPMHMQGSLIGSLVKGAAVNTAFGGVSRATTSAVLESGGYHQMAEQYKVLDGEAILADALLGAAFGGVGHTMESVLKRPTQDLVDRALDVRGEEQKARGAAGIPKDLATANLDGQLQERSITEMLQGKTPEISPEEARAVVEGTVADPVKEQLAVEQNQALTENLGPLADMTPPETVEQKAPESASLPSEAPPYNKEAMVDVSVLHPDTGEAFKMQVRAEDALRDNADRLEKMRGLLECLRG